MAKDSHVIPCAPGNRRSSDTCGDACDVSPWGLWFAVRWRVASPASHEEHALTVAIITAHYRVSIPITAGHVRTVAGDHTFTTSVDRSPTAVERLDAYSGQAMRRLADMYGVSPLLVVLRDISTDYISQSENEGAQ